jgi:hypothetical protein
VESEPIGKLDAAGFEDFDTERNKEKAGNNISDLG